MSLFRESGITSDPAACEQGNVEQIHWKHHRSVIDAAESPNRSILDPSPLQTFFNNLYGFEIDLRSNSDMYIGVVMRADSKLYILVIRDAHTI